MPGTGWPDPGQAGSRGGHKLTGTVMDFLEQHAAADPALSSAQLAAAVAGEFGVTVHKRSVERALAARRGRRGRAQGAAQKQLAPSPEAMAPARTRARRRSPAPTSSCAASPPAGSAAAGGTGQRCWPPRAWRRGWPRGRVDPRAPPADQRDGAAAQAQAGQPLPAIPPGGGQNAGPACALLLPAATSQLIAVMAQLTLHHARARARAASPFPFPVPDRESIPP